MENRYFTNVFSDSGVIGLDASYNSWKDRINLLIDGVIENVPMLGDNELYTGTMGVAYMFHRLTISKYFKNNSKRFLNEAITVLSLKENHFGERSLCRFICGDAGVSAVYAVIYHQSGDDKKAEFYLKYFKIGLTLSKQLEVFKHGGDELFVGRTGYLFGVLWLEKVFGKKIIDDKDIIEICLTIVESGRNYSKKNKSIFPLMYSFRKIEYLGAAHGLCTILQILLSIPQFIERDLQAKQDIKKCIDILITLQTTNGNFPRSMNESSQRPEKDELVHWCHGAPGVIYLLAKAYLIFKEPLYLECCLKCGDLVWTKGLLKKGPGLCHGIAGNGYVFLLLYRLTGDPKHLNRAIQFGEFIFSDEFKRGSRRPDSEFSLFEGYAGTVCYLIDLIEPEKAHFPFLDVF